MTDESPHESPIAVQCAAGALAGDGPQSDDLTMLSLDMKTGSDDMKKLKVAADVNQLDEVIAFVDACLEAHDCPMKVQMQVDLCVEEVFVNIAHYAYTDGGDAEVHMCVEDGLLILTFLDEGTPYNPLAKADPDVTLSANERQIGGLGIFLVKKNMDEVTYRYENGKNVLTMKKQISPEGGTVL